MACSADIVFDRYVHWASIVVAKIRSLVSGRVVYLSWTKPSQPLLVVFKTDKLEEINGYHGLLELRRY